MNADSNLSQVQAMGGWVVVGIGPHLDSGGLEDSGMVRPGRVAEPETRLGEELVNEIRGHPQGPGAPGSLGGDGALAGDHLVAASEEEMLYCGGKLGGPFDGRIVLGSLVLEEALLGLLDCGENRRVALSVFVDADPQVDLVGMGILLERLGESDNRVWWSGVDRFKHR